MGYRILVVVMGMVCALSAASAEKDNADWIHMMADDHTPHEVFYGGDVEETSEGEDFTDTSAGVPHKSETTQDAPHAPPAEDRVESVILAVPDHLPSGLVRALQSVYGGVPVYESSSYSSGYYDDGDMYDEEPYYNSSYEETTYVSDGGTVVVRPYGYPYGARRRYPVATGVAGAAVYGAGYRAGSNYYPPRPVTGGYTPYRPPVNTPTYPNNRPGQYPNTRPASGSRPSSGYRPPSSGYRPPSSGYRPPGSTRPGSSTRPASSYRPGSTGGSSRYRAPTSRPSSYRPSSSRPSTSFRPSSPSRSGASRGGRGRF